MKDQGLSQRTNRRRKREGIHSFKAMVMAVQYASMRGETEMR